MFQSSARGGGGGFAGGLTGPVPRDLWILLAVILATLALRFFEGLRVVPLLLELSPAVWQRGFVWQLGTYPFVGSGAPGFWFVIELAILLLFARDVYWRLGRKGFWEVILVAGVGAGLAATLTALAGALTTGIPVASFDLLQGQRALLTIVIAAFATINSRATIMLFFVLPITASWFLGLEILFAFLGFLSNKDLAGFVGICVAVGLTYLWLSPGSWRSRLRQPWLKLQEAYLRWKLKRVRSRSGLRIVKPEGKGDSSGGANDDPWVN